MLTGLERSWGLIRAEQLTAYGGMLYVAGRTAADESQGVRARVYSARVWIATAKVVLRKVSPPLGGTASTLGAQGARLFVGGTFSSAGGVARANLAAFDVRTGMLLPWRPSADSVVTGLAAANGKIYVGGYFSHVEGKVRRGLAAVTASGAGRLLPWRPGLSYSSGISLAIGHGRVFVGGTFIPAGQKRTPGSPIGFTHLAAFSASGPGARIPFASHALNTAPGGALGVAASSRFAAARSSSPSLRAWRLSPFDGDGRHELWRRPVRGTVNAFATSGQLSTSAGDSAESAEGRARTSPPSRSTEEARCSPSHRPVTQEVVALAPLRGVLIYGGTASSTRRRWHQALGAVAPDGTSAAAVDAGWEVDCIAPFSGGLVVAGSFDWLGPQVTSPRLASAGCAERKLGLCCGRARAGSVASEATFAVQPGATSSSGRAAASSTARAAPGSRSRRR